VVAGKVPRPSNTLVRGTEPEEEGETEVSLTAAQGVHREDLRALRRRDCGFPL